MSLEITSETERIVREELSSGHFHTVDDLIVSAVQAWRERNQAAHPAASSGKSLIDFFRESPLVGLELAFTRDRDNGQDIAL